DLAEEVGAVALLGGHATLAAGLGPGHPLALAVRFRHVRNTSRWSSPGKSGPLCSQMRHKATTNPDESHPNDSRTRSRPSTLQERSHPCRRSTRMEVSDLLRRMVEMGGSDVHLKVGGVPFVRVDGVLTATDLPALEAMDTEAFAAELLPPAKAPDF